MNSVTVEHIVKTYGTKKEPVVALKDISIDVAKGELFGVIGPDGAGKTSLFRILTTLLLADSGHARVDGFDVVKQYKEIRNRIGYMPGKFSLYQDLSVEENLRFFATIFNTSIAANYGLIKDIYTQIEPFKNRRAGKLSGGMKQKLALCCALIHRPSVLFLDEPTTGVDAVSRKEFWDMLKALKQQGISILVSTPYMDEAGLCDRVALIQSGSIMTIDSPENITKKFTKTMWSVSSAEMYRLLNDLQQYSNTEKCYAFGEFHHLVLKNDREGRDEIMNYLLHLSHHEIELQTAQPNIEDCFIDLMSGASNNQQ
ncbi:MAG: ABC transporter ATP-binding protein [Ferruginibacter sp.]